MLLLGHWLVTNECLPRRLEDTCSTLEWALRSKPKRLGALLPAGTWVFEYDVSQHKAKGNPGYGGCLGKVVRESGNEITVAWADGETETVLCFYVCLFLCLIVFIFLCLFAGRATKTEAGTAGKFALGR